ncbi:hypothetical protein RD792_015571, partial [Penstemon davidsonii]
RPGPLINRFTHKSQVTSQKMMRINMKLQLLIVILVVMLFSFTSSDSDNTKDKEECTESLVGLATCLTYVGGTAKAPTPDCCSGLKQVLKTKKKCLCVIIKDRNDPDLGLNINVTLALTLPQVCNAPANISQCPALLKLAPDSPDAQVFYEIGQKSSSNNTGGPISPPPTSPGANSTGTTAHQTSGGPRPSASGKGQIWLSCTLLILLVLLGISSSNCNLFTY